MNKDVKIAKLLNHVQVAREILGNIKDVVIKNCGEDSSEFHFLNKFIEDTKEYEKD